MTVSCTAVNARSGGASDRCGLLTTAKSIIVPWGFPNVTKTKSQAGRIDVAMAE